MLIVLSVRAGHAGHAKKNRLVAEGLLSPNQNMDAAKEEWDKAATATYMEKVFGSEAGKRVA